MKMMIHPVEAAQEAEAVQVAVPAEAVQFSMHRHIQRNVRRAVILPVPARAKAAGQKELRMTAPTTVRMTEQRDRQRKPETKVHR